MLASEPRRITDLETYFSRTLGLTLFALALLTLILSGVVPLRNDIADETDGKDNNKSPDPYAYPTLVVTTTYHALTAFYIYAQFTYRLGSFAFGVGLTASGVLFCVGVWVVLFASEKGRISKTTGADKRTGNFPFENKESAREKKKEIKRRMFAPRTSSLKGRQE